MSDMQGAGAAFSATSAIGGGYVEAAALRNQADYEKKLAELSNKTLEYQANASTAAASDAEKRGAVAVNARQATTRMQEGNVRAQAAAAGAVGSEAEAGALGEAETNSAASEAALRVNAFREAYGLQSQAIAIRGQEALNTFNATTKANQYQYMAKSSMITGFTKAMGSGLQAAGDASKGSKGSGGSGGKPSGGWGGADSGSSGGLA